jgi:hypothetical protein
MLDYLDELVGPDKAMIAESGPERRHALKLCALANWLGDKTVACVLRFYGRGASRVVQRRALSGAVSACRGLRSVAAVWGNRAAAESTERVTVRASSRSGVGPPWPVACLWRRAGCRGVAGIAGLVMVRNFHRGEMLPPLRVAEMFPAVLRVEHRALTADGTHGAKARNVFHGHLPVLADKLIPIIKSKSLRLYDKTNWMGLPGDLGTRASVRAGTVPSRCEH